MNAWDEGPLDPAVGTLTGVPNNALINSIADRLTDELVTSTGAHSSQRHIFDVVAAAAAPLADAPLQQFVALLVENAARRSVTRASMEFRSSQRGAADDAPIGCWPSVDVAPSGRHGLLAGRLAKCSWSRVLVFTWLRSFSRSEGIIFPVGTLPSSTIRIANARRSSRTSSLVNANS